MIRLRLPRGVLELRRPFRRLTGALFPTLACSLLIAPGCLKTLDETLLDQNSGGTGGTVASGGSGATGALGGSGGSGGSGATGGSAGTGVGGTGASSGSGGVAGSGGAPLVPTFEGYDSAKYPSANIVGGIPNALIAADADHVFRVERDSLAQLVGRADVVGGGATPISSSLVDNATVLLAPAGTLFAYVGASQGATEDVRLVRFLKDPQGQPNDGQELVFPGSPRLLAGLSLGEPKTMLSATELYMTARTSAPNQPHVFRIRLDSLNVERLYTAPEANETGGPIAQRGACVYWISNGRIHVMPKDGGTRADALENQISDAVGLAIDSNNFYYTRGEGSVWQRPLDGAGCSGTGVPEQRLVPGFTGLGDIVAYEDKIAWLASGSDYGDNGSGIFSVAAGSADIIQVASGGADPPKNLIEVADKLIYISEFGVVARVPKNPQ